MPDWIRPKFALRRLRPTLGPRESLLARLDDALGRKLTLLSAPAGFGKTTLVNEWIASREARGWRLETGRVSMATENTEASPASLASSPQPLAPTLAWLSLDAGDNDPARFWSYVITACQAFQADIGASALDLLQTAPQPS